LQDAIQAYLLPLNKPASKGTPVQTNYQWNTPGEVDASVLAASTPVKLQLIPSAVLYQSLHTFRFNAPGNRFLYIKINAGLPGLGNYLLKNSYTTIEQAPPYPRQLQFLYKGSLLTLQGEHKMSVLVRGIPTVKFTVSRIFSDQINHLVSQTAGDFNDPNFISYSFGPRYKWHFYFSLRKS